MKKKHARSKELALPRVIESYERGDLKQAQQQAKCLTWRDLFVYIDENVVRINYNRDRDIDMCDKIKQQGEYK